MDYLDISGSEIEPLLTEVSTYDDLLTGIKRGFPNTKKRQNATGPVHITKVKYSLFSDKGDQILQVTGLANSNNHKYYPQIRLSGVNVEEQNTAQNATIQLSSNQEVNITPIKLSQSTVKVKCTCLDFYWRFSTWNHGDQSLMGNPPPPYQPTGNRPPVNPTKTPGVCKHIIKTLEQLRRAKVVI